MVHRDIKPQNLMITPSGVVKILDFGLASFAQEAIDLQENGDAWKGNDVEASRLTSLGVVIGTPDYLPPEQISNASDATIRSDIYSLGCTLYFLLTGRPPFAGDSVTDKLQAHVQAQAKAG